MDFEEDTVIDDIDFQTEIDNSGKAQIPPTTWVTQSKRAYNQSKLVDFWGSEQNANQLVWDEMVDTIPEKDEQKLKFIREYGIEATQQEKTLIEQTHKNGDWTMIHDGIVLNTPKGKEMVNSIFGNNFNKMKGYSLSLGYDNLSPKSINAAVTKQTADEYNRLGGLLAQDDWNEEFGSQLIGGTGAYLTDPIGLSTVVAEVLVLSKVKAVTSALGALRKTKGVNKILDKLGMPKTIKELLEATTKLRKMKNNGVDDIEANLKGIGREELAAIGLIEGIIGGASETLQQYLSYDFKSTVVKGYGKDDSVQAVGIVAGLSMMLPMVGKSLGDKLIHSNLQKQMDRGKKAEDELTTLSKEAEDDIIVSTQEEKDVGNASSIEEADAKKQEAIDALDDLFKCFMNELR